MQIKTSHKMEEKAILPLLLSMAFPPMVSMLIQALYNIIDSIFVAQISENALTAISLAFPIQNLIIALSVGIGVGVNSYISRKLGEQKPKEVQYAITHGLILSAVTALMITVLGLFTLSSFFSFFTSDPFILEDASIYTRIILSFCIAPFIHICIEKVFQATGNMVIPMGLQAIGAIINIILDPIMIFGYFGFPAMGIAGAAIATIIGQCTSMILSICILLRQKHQLNLRFFPTPIQLSIFYKILVVAIPSACMNALGSVLVVGLNALLVTFSNLAVAVFGIYFKLQTFIFMPVSGLIQGAMPIMGYNYGAKNKQRLIATLKNSYLISFMIMAFGFLLFMIFPEQLLQFFHATDEMLAIGVPALRIISISFLPASLGIILSTLFQSTGSGGSSLLIFLLRQLFIVLPLSYLLSNFFGLPGVWISFLFAEGGAAIVAQILYLRFKRKDPIFMLKDSSEMDDTRRMQEIKEA